MTEQHAATEHHAADPHDAPHVNYMHIFYALIVLTFLSVLADVLGGTRSKIMVGLIVLLIASCKATFVMLYFMHLKFEGRWKFVLLAPTIVLAMALVVALVPDIGVHYYDVQTSQTLEHSGTSQEHAVERDHAAPLPLPKP